MRFRLGNITSSRERGLVICALRDRNPMQRRQAISLCRAILAIDEKIDCEKNMPSRAARSRLRSGESISRKCFPPKLPPVGRHVVTKKKEKKTINEDGIDRNVGGTKEPDCAQRLRYSFTHSTSFRNSTMRRRTIRHNFLIVFTSSIHSCRECTLREMSDR